MGTLAVESKPLKSNASKPSEHPPSGESMSKGLGGNIGCRDETSSTFAVKFAAGETWILCTGMQSTNKVSPFLYSSRLS